ncbi:MAG: outer membrane protein assembly factor BamE [Bacteroidales bacterium]|nr:outer membrane protein assembly factor BamE [Bacteroidales bacterium]MDY0215901.1 outer membrane protein assembly factor BamE [Bacteroidales bacterium]
MNYKRNRKIILLIIIVLAFAFFVIVRFTPSARKSNKNVVNSEKVKLGMTKAEVLLIMGEPDTKLLSYFNKEDTMYYYEPPFGASSGIYIQFEDSSGIVNRTILYE